MTAAHVLVSASEVRRHHREEPPPKPLVRTTKALIDAVCEIEDVRHAVDSCAARDALAGLNRGKRA